MTDGASSLSSWQQGDFALNVGGFLFGVLPDGEDLAEDETLKIAVRESDRSVIGAVLVSQTCDIVRVTDGKDVIAVCPLIERTEAEQKEIAKGRRPSLAIVENSPPGTYADLSRIMSVSKGLVLTWTHQNGFSDPKLRLRFASALERKFGRFAFPDDFNAAMAGFQKRVWSKHDKDSDLGKIYRSVQQIRFRVTPDWNAARREIMMVAILHDADAMKTDRTKIGVELKEQVDKIELPDGYMWAEPKFVLLRLAELSAKELLESQPADFDFLSS